MDVDFDGDVTNLDAELLQLSEVSPMAIKANPHIPEKLFDQWLLLPDTVSLVKSLVNNAKGGGPLNVSGTFSIVLNFSKLVEPYPKPLLKF